MQTLWFFLLLPLVDFFTLAWALFAFALGYCLARQSLLSRVRRLLPVACCLLPLSGCTAAENFFAHDRKLAVDGLYTVTQYGMLGVGSVRYESTTPASEARLQKLEEQLETLQRVILALVAKLSDNPKSKIENPKFGF